MGMGKDADGWSSTVFFVGVMLCVYNSRGVELEICPCI